MTGSVDGTRLSARRRLGPKPAAAARRALTSSYSRITRERGSMAAGAGVVLPAGGCDGATTGDGALPRPAHGRVSRVVIGPPKGPGYRARRTATAGSASGPARRQSHTVGRWRSVADRHL